MSSRCTVHVPYMFSIFQLCSPERIRIPMPLLSSHILWHSLIGYIIVLPAEVVTSGGSSIVIGYKSTTSGASTVVPVM